MRFVDPKTDIAFKKIFGNEQHKNVLIEFLNEILQLDYLIVDVTILNGYQAPKIKDLKESLLDIRAKDQLGHEFIVEMQVEKDVSFYKRAIYYSSKAYSQQLKKVEQYKRLKPVIFLGILDFTVFEHDNPTSRHLILNQENQHHDLKDLEFNFVELPKFNKTEAELETVSDKWLYFLKNADDLESVPISATTEALKTAYDIANQYTWSEQDLAIYEDQGMRLGRIQSEIETGRLEGIKQGIQQGIQQGIEQGIKQGIEKGIEQGRVQQQRQIVLTAYQNGLAIELIAQLCALSIADVQTILNEDGK